MPPASTTSLTAVDLPNDSQQMAVLLVGKNKKVLEIGCSGGHVTRRLAENGCLVTGIEIDPDMAKAAEQFATRVLVADLDATTPVEILDGETFDVIVVGDVFEHLKDPVTALRSLGEVLNPGGQLVSSIPNVTHADVRLMLLSGLWRYQDGGLLDRTHLRFFDASGVAELFASAGWRTIRAERTIKDAFESELGYLLDRSEIPSEAISYALSDPESRTYQFVVVAVPETSEAEPPAVTVASAQAAEGASTVLERLLEENEFLRTRVRALGEDIEDVHWQLERARSKAPRQRITELFSRIRGLLGRVRSYVSSGDRR